MKITKQYVKDGRIIRELEDNKKIIGPTEEEISTKSLVSCFHLKELKTCVFCGSTFDYGKESWASSCGLCKIEYKCAGCGEIKISTISSMNAKSQKKLLIGENFTQCCSRKCVYVAHTLPGICITCGKDTGESPRDVIGRCTKCQKLQQDKSVIYRKLPGICATCGVNTVDKPRDAVGRCDKCKDKYYADKQLPGICTTCGEDTGEMPRNPFGRCLKCRNKDLADRQLPGICMVCGEDTGEMPRDPWGKCKKCQDKHLEKLHPEYFTEDNKCKKHPNEPECFKGECLTCYNERVFGAEIVYDEFIGAIAGKYGGFGHVTGLIQDVEIWENRGAFERNLVAQGIGWFVYIKFSVNKDRKLRPHSVCKTGSLGVSNGFTDIRFSMNKNSSSVRFLLKNELKWDMSQIMIIPCESNEEAFRIEKMIQQEYELFG